MIGVLFGFVLGMAAFALYKKLANLPLIREIAATKREHMRLALRHQGSFSELLQIQKQILILACKQLRHVFLPACISLIPILIFLCFRPQDATAAFAAGLLLAYIAAKIFWKI